MAQNLAIFAQSGSRFCTLAKSSKNRPLSFFDPKKSFTNKTAGSHFVFLPKTRFWSFGAPCAAPKLNFSQKMSQKLRWIFLGKVKPYNHHLSIKNIEKIPFKKVAGGIRPPPGLIGLMKKWEYSYKGFHI